MRTIKQQAEQIQKVSAQLELSKPHGKWSTIHTPVGVGAASQPWIAKGERFSWLTHIAMTSDLQSDLGSNTLGP